MPSTEELETKEQYAAVLSRYDTLLFDCDGVIWEGDELIPGARQVLQWLRAQGKRCFFVTNNATKSREANKAKFDKMGIECAVVSLVLLPLPRLSPSLCCCRLIGFEIGSVLFGDCDQS